MKSEFLHADFLIAFLTLVCPLGCSRAPAKGSTSLNLNSAATYLDNREMWWMQWVGASRDHGTFCVSCHTTLPYALARPALRAANGDLSLSPDERELMENVRKRVQLWKETKPYYSEEGYDQKIA